MLSPQPPGLQVRAQERSRGGRVPRAIAVMQRRVRQAADHPTALSTCSPEGVGSMAAHPPELQVCLPVACSLSAERRLELSTASVPHAARPAAVSRSRHVADLLVGGVAVPVASSAAGAVLGQWAMPYWPPSAPLAGRARYTGATIRIFGNSKLSIAASAMPLEASAT